MPPPVVAAIPVQGPISYGVRGFLIVGGILTATYGAFGMTYYGRVASRNYKRPGPDGVRYTDTEALAMSGMTYSQAYSMWVFSIFAIIIGAFIAFYGIYRWKFAGADAPKGEGLLERAAGYISSGEVAYGGFPRISL